MLKLSANDDGVLPATGRRSWQITHDRLIVIATVVLTTVTFICGEKVGVGNGLGWDGQRYGEQAKDLFGEFAENSLDEYYVHRILPPAVVHAALRLLPIERTDARVIIAFGALNIFCAAAVAWFWCAIARELQISVRGRWLGFCALILNFAVAKHAAYYPVLTDMPAYAIGCGMLYFYLSGRTAWLMLLTAMGSFTWPTLFMQGLVLLAFPRKADASEANETIGNSPNVNRLARYAAGAFVAYCFLLVCEFAIENLHLPICGYVAPLPNLELLSMAIVAGYLFSVVFRLVDIPHDAACLWRLVRHHAGHLAAVVMLVVTVKVLEAGLVQRPGLSNENNYLLGVPIKAISKPSIFLVAHVVYYGPVVLLGMLLWTRVSQAICTAGTGIRLLLTFTLLHAIDSESRHLIYAFPLFVPFVIKATDEFGWSQKQYLMLAAMSLAWSKLWLTINVQPLVATASLLEYPQQYYAMNYGPFMTNAMYALQSVAAILTAIMIWQCCFAQRKQADNFGDQSVFAPLTSIKTAGRSFLRR